MPGTFPSVVIVLLTTSVNPRELAQAQPLPIAGTLTKPLPEARVQALLQTYFSAPAA